MPFGSFSFPKHACCEWIVSARVKTIYVGVGDPDPNVEGEGIKFLKENCVEVKSFPKEYQEIIWTYNKEFEKQAKARLKKDVKKRTMHILKEIIASDKGLNLLSEKALIEYSNALGYEYYRDKAKVIDHLLDMELIFKDDNGNYKITKYALVLFGENPSLKMPQACIKFLFHYKSGDIYQATYDGPMIIAVNDAIKRISNFLPHVSKINLIKEDDLIILSLYKYFDSSIIIHLYLSYHNHRGNNIFYFLFYIQGFFLTPHLRY